MNKLISKSSPCVNMYNNCFYNVFAPYFQSSTFIKWYMYEKQFRELSAAATAAIILLRFLAHEKKRVRSFYTDTFMIAR